ncbi:hypothetical protein D3C75_1045970 [compost metagenome]
MPPGSFSLNAFSTSVNSSKVVGVFRPSLSSQSWRIIRLEPANCEELFGMAKILPSTLTASKDASEMDALILGPYSSMSGVKSTSAPILA